ncbi:MAG: tetratricopeptide repeat protein [Bdellovibrionales bacterium]|nr:tetratricopeptide repeat protein [Bdellovibrionales bacterium]
MILQLVFTFIISTVLNLYAQPKIQTSSMMEITYGSSPWNTDPGKVDTAFLFVQDKNTQKTVKIFLEETSVDSAIFKGKFSLSLSSDKKFAPAIYIPPMNLRSVKANESFYKLLNQKKVKRRPIVFKRDKPYSKLEVFDTKEQAKQAVQALKKEFFAKKLQKKSKTSDKQKILNDLAVKSAQQEMDRLRLSQLEKQKIQERLEKQKKMKKEQIEQRKKQAENLSNEALELYKLGKYIEAERLFKQSTDLDPTNTSYYFKYGVTLYRNEKYNEALVIFDLLNNQSNEEEIEKRYYMAMIHYKLEELDQAIEQFEYVKTKGHPVLSPSSAFYNGVIQFGKESYKLSKANFEYVLDNSKDPKMDEKAEEFIEKIARIQQFHSNKALKNSITGLVGLGYDSNVLNSPDSSDQGTATNVASPRLMALGSYQRRLIYELDHEFSAKLTSLYMYSLDDDAATADPFLITTQLPYSYKSKLFNKGYKFTI